MMTSITKGGIKSLKGSPTIVLDAIALIKVKAKPA